MKVKEIAVHILSLVLGAVGYVLSKLVMSERDMPEQTRMLAAFFVSVAFFIAVQRLGEHIRLTAFERRLADLISARLPGVEVTYFRTSDEAMAHLTNHVSRAKACVNTRISREAVVPKPQVAKPYEKAVREAIRGGASYREIVSRGFAEQAKALSDFAVGKTGNYTYAVTEAELNCFVNFTVLDYGGDEEKEVVLGWTTSKGTGTEQPAISISDTRVADFYSQYFVLLNSQ